MNNIIFFPCVNYITDMSELPNYSLNNNWQRFCWVNSLFTQFVSVRHRSLSIGDIYD